MKVLLLQNYFHVRSGAGTGMFQDASVLRDEGHEVHFFCTDRRPFWDETYPHVERFPRHVDYGSLTAAGKLAHAVRPFWNREAARKLASHLAAVRPDVVHEHSTAFQLTPAVLRACDRAGVPVVMTIHGPGLFCPAGTLVRGDGGRCEAECCVRRRYTHALLHRCVPGGPVAAVTTALVYRFYDSMRFYGNVARFVCATETMRALALRAGLPEEKLVVAPYGFPRAAFDAAPQAGEGRHFLFAGRLEREKGVHHLLEAMWRLPREVRLVVAGSGAEEEPLRRRAAALGLANVDFVGWREGAALAALYRDAIATVLPCDWFEAFGLTLVESFLHGRPVVASRAGGIPEVVDHEADGLLVPPRDPGALAAALARLHADPALASELGRRGRAKAEARYHARVRYEALMRIYRSVVRRESVA